MPATSSKPEYNVDSIDDELANGPLAKRSCRDPLCCLLFVLFMGGMVGIAIWGYTQGNPNIIGRGYDTDGRMCGVDDAVKDYPYLYFPTPVTTTTTTTSQLNKALCLSSCPTSDTLPATLSCVPTGLTGEYPSCVADGNNQTLATDYATSSFTRSDGKNKIYVYATKEYVSRFCIPTSAGEILKAATNTMMNSSGADILEQWISDIKETWPVIAVSIAIAFVIGFIYMVLLRYCSGILTWFAILAFIAGTAILGWRFYESAKKLEDENTAAGNTDDSSTTSKTVLMEKVIAYICWGVAGFTFLAVLCLYSRIKLAIAIMKAAADYVKDTPSVFLVPPVTVVILLIFYAFWSGAAVFLVSSGEPVHEAGDVFGSFTFDKTLKRLLIYHLFGLLWFNAFVLAATQFILASSTAIWYFSQGTGQAAPKTIRTSIRRFFRYHFGSIAFGSLILAIVQLVRIILAYMEAQANKMKGKDNKIIKFTLACLQCYVGCFERFIKFLNKNAYIQIALSGKSFCGAAKDAFVLIVNNPLRMGVVSSIGSIFVFFGKIFIAAITALIAFIVLTNWDRYSENIYSPFIPTLVIFIFAYVIGAVFMTVYGLAADAILACFILDEQINKKKNAPPRHCPSSLRDFLDKHKKN